MDEPYELPPFDLMNQFRRVTKQRDDLVKALEELLDSTVYADAEGSICVENGGCDDTEHREIVARCRAAIAAAKE